MCCQNTDLEVNCLGVMAPEVHQWLNHAQSLNNHDITT